MKIGKRGWDPEAAVRILALALVFALLASVSPAGAETPSGPAELDLDLMMASNAIAAFRILGEDGKLMVPRKAPEVEGRGEPSTAGEEPDYRGIAGYMALQTSWDVTRFNTFTKTPWMLPVYEPDGDGWKVVDTIRHKTPVLVVDQRLREEIGKKFRGYLQVVRLDIHREVWIDASQFVTVPYWTMGLKDAIQYGYCVAVYRNKSRYEPMDKRGRRGTIPDGMRVLVINQKSYRAYSKDKEHNPIQAIVFRSREESESYFRTFLFFNPDDLTMVY